MKLGRREFLALVAAGAAACKRSSSTSASSASSTASSSASANTSASSAPVAATRILPVFEAKIIDAVAARILPSPVDASDGPGAREVNALHFIDGQLAEGDLAPLANGVIATARVVENEATKRHAVSFVDLDPSRQDAILADLSRAKLPVAFPQREAFRLLHMLTLEALLSDPLHGGNTDMIGWKWIRFPTPTLRFPGDSHSHDHDAHHDHHE